MHLLFDPVLLAVPGGAGVTARTHLDFAAHLLDWDEIAHGVQHTYCVSAEFWDALMQDDCFPDQATLHLRWKPAGVRMSPDAVTRVARSILDRTPALEKFFADDLAGVLVDEKQCRVQPDLPARLPEKTAVAFRRALSRVAWLRASSSAAPAAGANPADLLLATRPFDGPAKAAAVHAEVMAGDSLVAVDNELPLATHPSDLDPYFDLSLAWREPAAAIRVLARSLLNKPLKPMVARRLEQLRVGPDFCESIWRHQINRQQGYLKSVFRKCVMLLADDASTHDEKQHHRLGEGNSAVGDGDWQAWRLWVNDDAPGYRLHYWRNDDTFIFMHVRLHDDYSIERPPG